MVNSRYFEDCLGEDLVSSAYRIEAAEIREFAGRWDPLPIHLDDAQAREAGFDGMTASGLHLLAIKHRLLYEFGFADTVIASFGLDDVRYLAPGRPGDDVRVHLTWGERRLSGSRPGCGIVKHHNQLRRVDGTVLMSLTDTVLMRCREAA